MTANLSQEQKDYFTEMAETSLNDLCTLKSRTGRSQNSYGDIVDTYTDFEDVPCGISFKNTEYKNELGQAIILQVDAILRVTKSLNVKVSDLILCRGKTFTVDGVYEGVTLQILGLKYFSTKEP